ncbi:MAG: DUF308 domain-containing protein [Candidatus Bathyarchaeota archaeon]|nr:DUF308 domain-containing protein [Candidatus Bathyarchaeota archaeon]
MSKTSGAYRALEIILGLVALAVGVLALVFPTAVVVTLVVFFGIALLIIGILRVATAASSSWTSSSSRKANAAIGILAIIFGVFILFVPLFATEVLVILIGIALLIYGIGRIAVGGAAGNLSGGLRGILIVVGILIAVFALIVIFFPIIGVFTYAFFVSIAFILIGIDSIASGIVGSPMMT